MSLRVSARDTPPWAARSYTSPSLHSSVGAKESCVFITLSSNKSFRFSRDAIRKSLYSNLFSWIVRRINVSLRAEESETLNGLSSDDSFLGGNTNQSTIGCLDIFGFEHFQRNGFEQLCINYVNERLQGLFVNHIFKSQLDLYRTEGIQVRAYGRSAC
jgi:myosin-1